jgi:hypothetical protein
MWISQTVKLDAKRLSGAVAPVRAGPQTCCTAPKRREIEEKWTSETKRQCGVSTAMPRSPMPSWRQSISAIVETKKPTACEAMLNIWKDRLRRYRQHCEISHESLRRRALTSLMNTNDLVYKIAARVAVLATESLPELRYSVGTADTWNGAQRENRHKNRGELIEEILHDEFIEEFPKEIAEDCAEITNLTDSVQSE